MWGRAGVQQRRHEVWTPVIKDIHYIRGAQLSEMPASLYLKIRNIAIIIQKIKTVHKIDVCVYSFDTHND
jgi:hypothetical protein